MAPRVPAALHSELTEYASILRAIRTNSTLDIVPQLTQTKPYAGSSHVDSDQEGSFAGEGEVHLGDEEAVREPSKPALDNGVQKSLKGKGKVKSSKIIKRSRRKDDDIWTSWPLLKEQCPRPEWDFDEEVVAIAEQCLRLQSSSSRNALTSDKDTATSNALDSDGDDLSDFTLSPAHLSGLASDAASKLASILSLLASHRVNANFAKHGRISPMCWVDVLEVAGMAGLFDLT